MQEEDSAKIAQLLKHGAHCLTDMGGANEASGAFAAEGIDQILQVRAGPTRARSPAPAPGPTHARGCGEALVRQPATPTHPRTHIHTHPNPHPNPPAGPHGEAPDRRPRRQQLQRGHFCGVGRGRRRLRGAPRCRAGAQGLLSLCPAGNGGRALPLPPLHTPARREPTLLSPATPNTPPLVQGGAGDASYWSALLPDAVGAHEAAKQAAKAGPLLLAPRQRKQVDYKVSCCGRGWEGAGALGGWVRWAAPAPWVGIYIA